MKELKNERINTMKAIIKTNIVFVRVMGYRLWVMGLLLWMALPIMAQPQTFNGATAPQVTFQSTSTMQGSGSAYSSKPMLNSNGMATYEGASYAPAQVPSGPKKVGGHTIEGTPIGDAVLPLTLMCLLAAGVVYLRRRKMAQE